MTETEHTYRHLLELALPVIEDTLGRAGDRAEPGLIELQHTIAQVLRAYPCHSHDWRLVTAEDRRIYELCLNCGMRRKWLRAAEVGRDGEPFPRGGVGLTTEDTERTEDTQGSERDEPRMNANERESEAQAGPPPCPPNIPAGRLA